MKDYENYLLKEKIPFKEIPDLDNFNYEIKRDDINFHNLQSDNYITDSSDSNEENNIIDNKFSIEIKDNSSDGDDGNDNNNEKTDSNKNNSKKNGNNYRAKSKKNKHNYKNNKNSSDKNNHNLNVFHYNEINLDGEAKINNKIGKIKYFDEDFINLPYEKLRVYFININNNLKLKLRKKKLEKKFLIIDFNY